MRKKISRFLTTLVALFAMMTGAWAEEPTLLTTITTSSDFLTGSKTYDDIVTVNITGTLEYSTTSGETGWFGHQIDIDDILTITAVEGYTITSCIAYPDDASATGTTFTTSPVNIYLNGWYVLTGPGLVGDYVGSTLKTIEVYGYKNATGPEVTKVEGQTNQWKFQMPAASVELQVEYYPGMLTFGPATEGTGSVAIEGMGPATVTQLSQPAEWNNDDALLTADDLPGFVELTEDQVKTWGPTTDCILIYGFEGNDVKYLEIIDGEVTVSKMDISYGLISWFITYYTTVTADGLVTAVGMGEACIVVSIKGFYGNLVDNFVFVKVADASLDFVDDRIDQSRAE